ncbi:MAG: hypothetical protein LLG04_03000 [Parachlamydia sp.]|nr:hypothetical protein [Parachlamydia sp.]
MNILKKFQPFVAELENEHGPFLVFALFLREQPFEIWDVAVSATWLNAGEMRSFGIVGDKIKDRFNDSELIQISRVDILDADDPTTDYFLETFPLSSDMPLEVGREPLSSRFGSDIKYGYFLRCRKEETESD